MKSILLSRKKNVDCKNSLWRHLADQIKQYGGSVGPTLGSHILHCVTIVLTWFWSRADYITFYLLGLKRGFILYLSICCWVTFCYANWSLKGNAPYSMMSHDRGERGEKKREIQSLWWVLSLLRGWIQTQGHTHPRCVPLPASLQLRNK